MATRDEAQQGLRRFFKRVAAEDVVYGYLGQIVGDAYAFVIPHKPGYYYCRVESGLGLEPAECRCQIGLDAYTRCKFVRVNGVLEAKEYVLEDAIRNYGAGGAVLNVPGFPAPNSGAGGAVDLDGDDLLNAGLVQLTALNLMPATELTIASGAVTVTQAYHTVDTESDASSDELTTITVSSTRPFAFWLRAEHGARTVVIKHNTGNVQTFSGADVTLDESYQLAACLYDPALGKVLVWGVSAGGGASAAEDVSYDPTVSGLASTDVQAAIDELAAGGVGGTVLAPIRTKLTSNPTTTSGSLTPIDSTNLGYTQHQHTLAVGEMVELVLTGMAYVNATDYIFFDFEIDQPTSADVYRSAASSAGNGTLFFRSSSGLHFPVCVTATFVATEAGLHKFRPVWRTNAGTLQLNNAVSVPTYFTTKFLG